MKLTPKEAAKRACVSVSLIYALLKQRRLPALRVGVRGRGKWLIESDDLDGFLSECRVNELSVPDETDLKFLN